MAITRPTAGTYTQPSDMNTAAETAAYPDQWGALPTANPHIVPSAAFDELEQNWDTGATSSLADDCYNSTLD
ncbi:MAG: hypothetical protein ACLP3C_15600 [Mycobacterium sp.]|uniref:hypothetical protein n=1 Tax=Mycobacterium sp. TaxID=1785 RepID=UPI003F9C4321